MCETVGILKIELFHNNDIVQVMYNDYYKILILLVAIIGKFCQRRLIKLILFHL